MDLRQSTNRVRVIGTLKRMKVTEGTSKGGHPFISLDLVVQSKIDDKVMENKVSFWAKRSSKLASGYLTAANEYRTIEKDGEHMATRVSIDGNYEMNEYVSNGEYKNFPKIKGVFVNRVEESEEEVKDAVELKLECIVMDQQPEMKDGKLTGRLSCKLYSVGWGNTVNEFNNILVDQGIVNDFKRLFPIGTTASFNIKINNMVIIKEPEVQVQLTPTGFGQQLDSISNDNIIRDYINETIIIGGDMPIIEGKYTNEEITFMNQIRENKVKELMTPPQQDNSFASGFGSGFDSGISNGNASPTNYGLEYGDVPF